MEKELVISKWGVKGSRVIESDLEYDMLMQAISECVETQTPVAFFEKFKVNKEYVYKIGGFIFCDKAVYLFSNRCI